MQAFMKLLNAGIYEIALCNIFNLILQMFLLNFLSFAD